MPLPIQISVPGVAKHLVRAKVAIEMSARGTLYVMILRQKHQLSTDSQGLSLYQLETQNDDLALCTKSVHDLTSDYVTSVYQIWYLLWDAFCVCVCVSQSRLLDVENKKNCNICIC